MSLDQTDSENTAPITQLLRQARDSGDKALDDLYEAVYPVLRRMAANRLGRGSGHTVTPTVMVNELFLKLDGSSVLDSSSRTHFYATCARAMRFILADLARASLARKRGGGQQRESVTEAQLSVPDRAREVLELDRALNDLASVDDRLRQLVELKFFGGLSYAEIGEIQGLSERTVKRDWVRARAFLAARSSAA